MADKKEGKKEDKGGGGETPPHVLLMYWVVGIFVFLYFFLQNFNGTFFNIGERPIEDSETGRVVAVEDEIAFPQGDLKIGDVVILKEDAFVRSAPANSPLGKQKKYKTATVQDGPQIAYNQNWWRLNFEKAPDGWVPEFAFTSHTGTYKFLHIIPISWQYIKPIFWIVSIILGILYLIAKVRLENLRAEAEEKLKGPKPAADHFVFPGAPHIVVSEKEQQELVTAGDRRSNERWMHILQLMQSHNQNDWRQAIIEADIILEEMLEKMGYDGITIGDKLKNIEPSDFQTLNQAWEAHKIRNRIAHMGSEFQISHQETEKVINLYQEVFNEFYYI